MSGFRNLGNHGYGVKVTFHPPTANNQVGGPAGGAVPAGAGNTIAFNSMGGVDALGTYGTTIRGNAIYNNGGKGIDAQSAYVPSVQYAASGSTTTVVGTVVGLYANTV